MTGNASVISISVFFRKIIPFWFTTCDRRLPAESKLEEFRNSTALCLSNATCCLYKITEKNEQLLLIVWGSEDSVSTIGELAVCQIESILESYAEKMTKCLYAETAPWRLYRCRSL